MTIAQIRDTLAEATRYATSDPATADELAGIAENSFGLRHDGGESNYDARLFWTRLASNLGAARRAILADPQAFTSYCYAVSFELACLKGD